MVAYAMVYRHLAQQSRIQFIRHPAGGDRKANWGLSRKGLSESDHLARKSATKVDRIGKETKGRRRARKKSRTRTYNGLSNSS